jgi:hypothetical protein
VLGAVQLGVGEVAGLERAAPRVQAAELRAAEAAPDEPRVLQFRVFGIDARERLVLGVVRKGH